MKAARRAFAALAVAFAALAFVSCVALVWEVLGKVPALAVCAATFAALAVAAYRALSSLE